MNGLRKEAWGPALEARFGELERELQTVLSQPVEALAEEELDEVRQLVAGLAEWQETLGVPRLPFPASFPDVLAPGYRDVAYIAEGGFARVYRATYRDGLTVAVKVPIETDRSFEALLENEIRIWSGLNHKNVVRFYGCHTRPCAYLELEWVDGGTLGGEAKPIPVQDAARIVLGIADALRHAHAQGIIHCDIKPDNVLLTKDREPKVTDWGLSRVKSSSHTRSMSQRYTLLYAAPEQVGDLPGRIDESTDVYQLGAVFYEFVTGIAPFEGDTVAGLMIKIISSGTEPKMPSEINPLAKPVDDMILGCLRKQKEDRYSLARLQQDLVAYLHEEARGRSADAARNSNARMVRYCSCDCVMYSARENDVRQCLNYMEVLQRYAGSSEMRASLQDLAWQLGYYVRLNLGIDEEILPRIETAVQRVKML